MPTPSREPESSVKPSGLWARLLGAPRPTTATEAELVPENTSTWTSPPAAMPTTDAESEPEVDLEIPMATPVAPTAEASPEAPGEAPPIDQAPNEPEPPASEPQYCEACQAQRVDGSPYCLDCGWLFPERVEPVRATAAASPPGRLNDRYELQERVSVRGALTRYRGLDHGTGGEALPVVVVQMPFPGAQVAELSGAEDVVVNDPLVEAERAAPAPPEPVENLPSEWPGVGWELRLLQRASHPALPRVLDHFPLGDQYYLVESARPGRVLWEAWEDPATTQAMRFNWLADVADAMKALYDAGAIWEALRPEAIAVSDDGRVGINDLSDLLPMPLPPHPSIQATHYTAPELVLASETADGRAALYTFGALLYSLYVGRELADVDFERTGAPKPFVLQYPDAHPAVARLLMKTFVRERERRFPSDEAVKEEATGLVELARALRAAGRTLSQGRLDVASWTNTGIARTGNEDAFALFHSAGSRLEDVGERVLAILADGMGGYEAGEVAAAMAIEGIRQRVLKDSRFGALTGDAAQFAVECDVQDCEEFFADVLREVNRDVHAASRKPGQGKRGMGCTAELVYVDGQRLIVGHVGDSRTYLYADGRLRQVTRDQTLVNRLVELGQLTPEEAENHPRKNELQQAIGGQPFIDPAVYSERVKPGDWVLVCSDGLPNHVSHATLTEMIQRADSAEMCARRLVNLANAQGGSDNCTVIAIRIT